MSGLRACPTQAGAAISLWECPANNIRSREIVSYHNVQSLLEESLR